MAKEFPLEKILTISARDYCEMFEKELKQYEPRGVHVSERYLFGLEEFKKNIPEGTEVVVNFQFSEDPDGAYVCGTALIPKE